MRANHKPLSPLIAGLAENPNLIDSPDSLHSGRDPFDVVHRELQITSIHNHADLGLAMSVPAMDASTAMEDLTLNHDGHPRPR